MTAEISGNRWSWAAYLGASWTWCIGMFLPVLLIRDYGAWAWVIFALPNAVGAAAMGWVMRSQTMSHEYTIRHASACRLFSFVTIAFQLFFATWMLPRLVGPIGYIGAAIIVQSAFTPVTKSNWLRIGGAAALLISVGLAAGLGLEGTLRWPNAKAFQAIDAVGLLLVCLAGFIACPYLDLTFHRARQQTTDRDAKFSFGIGFCVLFFSMIVLTFFYALPMHWLDVDEGNGLRTIARILIAIHLAVQMIYTVHVHSDELVRQSESRDDAGVMRAGLSLWLAIGLAGGLFGTFALQHGWDSHGRSLGEACYRVFMSFYGLLFPAYVLLAVRKPRVHVVGWLTISALAAPFYWLAFLEAKMAWASVGVAVIVVGAIVVRRLTPPASVQPFE
ncbi:MAG: hypothetical protein QM754_15350 [Tepidisphaeraceae bacterium]